MRPMSLNDIRERWQRDHAARYAGRQPVPRVQASVPTGSISPALAAELDAISQQLRDEETADATRAHQKPTDAAQAYLKWLVKG